VKQRERLQNWLDYYELKFERHPERRPTGRVTFPTLILFYFICWHTKFFNHTYSVVSFPRNGSACCSFPAFQTGCLGFCGREVDQIDYYRARISELEKRVSLQFLIL
jgi:hypothetical protein